MRGWAFGAVAMAALALSACKGDEPPYYDSGEPLWKVAAWPACAAPCSELRWPMEVIAAEWRDDAGNSEGPVLPLPKGLNCTLVIQRRPSAAGKPPANWVRILCGGDLLYMRLVPDLGGDKGNEEMATRCEWSGDGEPGPGAELKCVPPVPPIETHQLELDSKRGRAFVTRTHFPRMYVDLGIGKRPDAIAAPAK
jgi:hypothetical protein